MAGETDKTVRQIQEAGASIGGFAGALLDTNPSLAKFSANITGVSKVLGYLTSNLTNLRKFASMGADFGMDINLMTTSVTGARSSFAALETMIKKNAGSLAMYDGIIGNGMTTFLALQKDFYFDKDGFATAASLGLERLGLTTENINETFLVYDRLQRYGRRGEEVVVAQRNMAAAAFAKELTTLARLTGQQADELVANMNTIMREGDVAAFSMTAQKGMSDVLVKNVASADALSKDFGALMRDIFIRARPEEDTALLQSMLPETAAILYAAEAAKRQGNAAAADKLLLQAQMSYTKEMQSGTIGMLAQQKGATRETMQAYKAVGQYASGAGFAIGDMMMREQEKLGRNLTGDEYLEVVEKVKAQLNALGDPPKPGDPRAVTDAIIKAEQELASMALAVQTQMRSVYTTLGESASAFMDLIKGQGKNAIDGTMEMFNGAVAAMGISGETSVEDRNRVAQSAIIRLNESLLTEQAQELGTIVAKLNDLDSKDKLTAQEQGERADLLSQFRNYVAAAPTLAKIETIRANQLIIDGTTINPNLVPPTLRPPVPNSVGTIGNYGNIIKDFGKETAATLHGREAVLNETQLTNLAKGLFNYGGLMSQNMSRDTIDAVAKGYISPETITRTITASLGGMLNTVRNNQSRQMPQMPQIDFTGLETEIGRIASQMKQPFEDALNNTLKMPLEQLFIAAIEGNDLQRKSVKGIQGMGNDYLRGA